MSLTCQAPKDKVSLAGCFGERCGAPATDRDWIGRYMCAACAKWSAEARANPNTLGSILSKAFKERP